MYKAFIFNKPVKINGQRCYGLMVGGKDDDDVNIRAASKFVSLVIENTWRSSHFPPDYLFSTDWDKNHYSLGEVTDRLLRLSDFEDSLLVNKETYHNIKSSGRVKWREITSKDTEIMSRAKSIIARDTIRRENGWKDENELGNVLKFADYNFFKYFE